MLHILMVLCLLDGVSVWFYFIQSESDRKKRLVQQTCHSKFAP